MSESSDNLSDQIGSFQKIWMETFSRMAQNAFAFTPDSAPPEMLRQMRSGIFEALAQSWDEYLRSPQFLDAMKQWMDSAIFFRKMTNDLLTKARHETQDIAREDIDSVMLAVRHMEKRILDRLESLSARVDELTQAKPNGPVGGAARRRATAARRQAAAAQGSRKPSRPSQTKNPL